MFCGHAAADRGGIGYHSLTPNTFTADTMINEPGAALQGLFLDPLDPLPTGQLLLTPPPPPPSPPTLDLVHLDKAHLGIPRMGCPKKAHVHKCKNRYP